MKDVNTIKKESPRFRIEIGELVLYGFDNNVKHQVSSQIEQELVRLIRENGLPQYDGSRINRTFETDNIRTNSLKNSNSRNVGYQVAQSVYKAMWTTNQPTRVRKN